MQDKQIQFKIDTGSQANILPVTTFRSLKDVQLETTAVKQATRDNICRYWDNVT
jgi:hypothetical protein